MTGVEKLFKHRPSRSTTRVTIALPCSTDAEAASPITPRSAMRWSPLVQGQLTAGSRMAARTASPSGGGLEVADALAAHQIGGEREHHRGFILAGMDFRHGPVRHRAHHRAKMQRPHIEAKIAAELASERLQEAAVAAVTVDDQQIRAGSARTISRQRSRSTAVRPLTESDNVPAAQSCSRDNPTANDGSRQRS